MPISDSGWWSSSFGHNASNKNYIADVCDDCTSEEGNHNNYFTFDLSAINGTITSASLNLYTYKVAGSSVEFQLSDVTSPLSEVHATGINATVYNDLMTGVSYGSFIYNASDMNQFRSLVLNIDGVSALNSAIGGEFGIGGSVVGGIEGPPPIPEPETYAMWLAGLGLLGFLGIVEKEKHQFTHLLATHHINQCFLCPSPPKSLCGGFLSIDTIQLIGVNLLCFTIFSIVNNYGIMHAMLIWNLFFERACYVF